MKKHLIAAAVAAAVAAPAFAQNVTIYGRIDQAFTSQKTTTGANFTKVTNSGLDGAAAGSRLGFRGTEDLGGGLKAGFVVEFGLDPGENTGVGGTRLGFAEIAGGFGTLRVGRQVSPTKAVADGYNALGNSTNFAPGDALGSLVDLDNRVSNAWTYLTPNFNGFTAQLQFADAVTTTQARKDSNFLLNGSAGADGSKGASASDGTWRLTQQGNFQGIGLNYASGPFAIAYAQTTQDVFVNSAKTETERQILAATYDFKVAKLHAEMATHEQKVAGVKSRDREVNTIGISVPLGSVVLLGQYFDGKRKAATGGTSPDGATEADYSGYKLRAAYNFSKRTSLYATLGETETKPTTGNKTKVEGYAIGLAHTF